MPSEPERPNHVWPLPVAAVFVAACVAHLIASPRSEPRVDVAYAVHVEQPMSAGFVDSVVATQVAAPIRSWSTTGGDALTVHVAYVGDDQALGRAAKRGAYRVAKALRPEPLTDDERAERLYAVDARLADLRFRESEPAASTQDLLAERARLLADSLPAPRVQRIREIDRPSTAWQLILAPAIALVVLAAALFQMAAPYRGRKLGGRFEAAEALQLPAATITLPRNWRAA